MTVHQLRLIQDNAEDTETFEAFWKSCVKKAEKAKTRVLFSKITAPGGTDTRSLAKDSGGYIELHLEATAEELTAAMKAYSKSLIYVENDKYVTSKYCLNPLTFLNSGRFEDFIDAG